MDLLSQGITIAIIATLFLVFVAIAIIILVLVYQKRQTKHLLEREKQILESKLETQEQTLKEVSQEIHDNIGQALILIKLNINSILIKEPDVAKEKLLASETIITKAIQDLRNIGKLLNTDYLNEIGLEKAIKQQLSLIEKTGLYETKFSTEGLPYSLTANQELVIFRVVQELLNNIMKHAEATRISVLMNYETEKLVIRVSDNGCGFDIHRHRNDSKGLGLKNISNRIKLIKGTILFESLPKKGTTVNIELFK